VDADAAARAEYDHATSALREYQNQYTKS
jgi:hypothetical protein